MYFMTQGQRVLILEKTKKLKGVSRHSQASMFMFADVAALQAEEPGEGSPMTAKEALGPIRPISQKSPFKNALKRKPLGDITNPPAATSSFDGPPFKKHLVAHERTLPDLGLGVWDQKELLDNRAARIRQLTQTAANGFQKLAPPQRLSYFRRHETEDILNAIYKHKERDTYAEYFRDAVDAAHNASIVANKGQSRSAAIAALALAHSVALYSALDSIVVSLGREKLHVPYTEANTFEILHRLKDAAPALWINESICAKGTHLANHTSEEFPFYREFMMAQEKQFGNAFVVFDQARQILECSPQPGMPHHCERAMAPSMWFYFNFGTTWVERARTEYDLRVFGVSTVGGCATKVGPCRTIADMATQWGVQQAQIISIPHYDKSTGSNSGKAAEMLELTLLKMQKVLQPGQAVDTERLDFLEALHGDMKAHIAIPCPHDRVRSTCKECGGSQICEHNHIRSTCKECGGGSICKHDRQRSLCKDCGGASICVHARVRSFCKECGGSQICQHGHQRKLCKECGGASICVHARQRSYCKECGGSQICEHDRQRYECKECGGSGICQHGCRRSQCKDCGGSQICQHGRRRSTCNICSPKKICRLCPAETRNKSGLCTSCNKQQRAQA